MGYGGSSGGRGKDLVCKWLLGISIAVLLHAGYSAAEWRSLTRKLSQDSEDRPGGQEKTSMPLDITIQTLFGLVLGMMSVVQIAGDFKEIRASIEMGKRTWETARNRPSFYVYNHRGKAFSPNYVPPCSPSLLPPQQPHQLVVSKRPTSAVVSEVSSSIPLLSS